MLPPRRAALPLGTSSLGACGALLPREPRPVEGSRGSRPARRSCVPSLPTGGGGSLHRRSGGRERGRKRAVGICRDGACRRSDESVRLRRGTRRPASGRGPPRTSGSRRGSTPWPRPGARPSSSASRRRRRSGTPLSRASCGDRACRGATDPGSRTWNGVAERASALTRTDRRTRRLGSRADRRRSEPTRRSSGAARPSTCFSPRSAGKTVFARAGPQCRPPGWREAYDASTSGRPAPASAASRDSRAVEGARCSRWPRRSGSPRSVSVSWAGTARRRPRPAGTP